MEKLGKQGRLLLLTLLSLFCGDFLSNEHTEYKRNSEKKRVSIFLKFFFDIAKNNYCRVILTNKVKDLNTCFKTCQFEDERLSF